MKIFIFVFIMALILAMIVSILGILKIMFSKLAIVLFHVFWSICASSGDIRDVGSIPESGRSPGGGNGNPLQYSCLETPMDGEAWVGYSPWGPKELGTTEQLSNKDSARTSI